jgi:hypothetical protein
MRFARAAALGRSLHLTLLAESGPSLRVRNGLRTTLEADAPEPVIVR